MTPRAPTSVVLDGLLGHEAPEQVTLGWLMGGLGDRSFGVVLLVLALLGLLPGVSSVAGVLLTVPAFQMILARPGGTTAWGSPAAPCSPTTWATRSAASCWRAAWRGAGRSRSPAGS